MIHFRLFGKKMFVLCDPTDFVENSASVQLSLPCQNKEDINTATFDKSWGSKTLLEAEIFNFEN